MAAPNPTLNCQVCDVVLRHLTPTEAQEVAERPYDFVVFCPADAPHAIE